MTSEVILNHPDNNPRSHATDPEEDQRGNHRRCGNQEQLGVHLRLFLSRCIGRYLEESWEGKTLAARKIEEHASNADEQEDDRGDCPYQVAEVRCHLAEQCQHYYNY